MQKNFHQKRGGFAICGKVLRDVILSTSAGQTEPVYPDSASLVFCHILPGLQYISKE